MTSLTTVHKDELDRLEVAIERIIRIGRSIPLNLLVFESARVAEMQHDLSPQDAIVFASVIADLASVDEASIFVSKNSNDFRILRREFAKRNCRYFSKFRDALASIRSDT